MVIEVVVVAKSCGLRLAEPAENQCSQLFGVVDAFDHAHVRVGQSFAVRPLVTTAPGRFYDQIGDAEVALQRTLRDVDVLYVFERDRRFVDDPDATADAEAAAADDIPRGVVAEMDG